MRGFARRTEMWLEHLARDIRYGFRALRRDPLFASVAVLTLAFGIGANTAIFSLADAVLVRTLPVSKPGDLVVLRQRAPIGDIFPFSSAAAEHLDKGHDTLSGLAAFRPAPNTHVGVAGETELTLTQSVSGNYHAVLGVHALVGRTLTEQDRDPVAVISHRYWQRRFAGAPDVVGRALDMQGRVFTIVGVTPPDFFGTQPGRHVDVTTPLAARTMTVPPDARWLYLIGRLASGMSRDQARTALRVRWTQLTTAGLLSARPPVTLELDAGAQGLNELRRQFSTPLHILIAAVGVVLLVACANLASLLILRSGARQQELAIRLSLGAARGRIVRQLMTETALLAAAGGIAGLMLAYWVTDLLLAMMARGRSPIALDVAPQARTFAFAAVVTIVTAALCGVLPALGASRADVQSSLKLKPGASGADRMRRFWGRAMLATQVALLVVLLASAGLFVRTLQKLHSVDAGFREDEVLVVNVSTGAAFTQERRRALYQDLATRFGALPGVRSVSLSMDTPPASELSMCGGIEIPGRPAAPGEAPTVCLNFAGPRFFETMGIPVLAGRDFEAGDDERAQPRVVISERVARHYFGNDDPLGRVILAGGAEPPARVPATIIGVVKDVRYTSLRTAPPMMIYRPARQESKAPADTLLIRTSLDAADALMPLLHAEIRAAAPGLPPPSVVSLEDRVAAGLVEERMLAILSGAIGALTALLAAMGIYSTAASAVARRRSEIGIRMALGARPGEVARMVVGETFAVVGAGLAIGLPLAIAAALAARALLAGVLFQLSPTDPLNLVGVTLAVLVIAPLAAYAPARRASRIDPVAAIKHDR